MASPAFTAWPSPLGGFFGLELGKLDFEDLKHIVLASPATRGRAGLSLNLGQEPEAPWALYIGDQDAPFAAKLSPGDALLYKGTELTHWRDAYEGERMFQVFLHYVDANGPNAAEKFDSRASTG